MKNRLFLKLASSAIVLAMSISLVACGAPAATPAASAANAPSTAVSSAADTKASAPVTLKFLSNLPDRTSGQGKLEQALMDNYMKENPNVKFEIETLQDEPYKQKFKAYTASNSLPDVFMVWGLPSFFTPVMKAGIAAELNPKDYENDNFIKGSTDNFSLDGKLYGLPRNTDYMFLYYNKALFDSNGVKVPTSYDELLQAAKAFRAKGIAPLAMNGKDKWAISFMIQDLALKVTGDQSNPYNALSGKSTFASDAGYLKGAQLFKGLMDAKLFQDSFTAADYGAANNLFAQGKAAMYYMGEWESGMAVNDKFPDSFKKNVHAVAFPIVGDGKGKATDLISWNGGGYAVNAKSQSKDEAIKFINYVFKPDNWSKLSWTMGVNVPAQKFDTYMTGNETDLQKEVVKILTDATSISGAGLSDAGTAGFKTDCETIAQSFAAGALTPEQYLTELDKAVAKAKAEAAN